MLKQNCNRWYCRGGANIPWENQNEQIINAAMLDLAKNKTVITVAHKLSAVINCDRIIFIKDGEIVESGSHAELMGKGGFYKKMYEAEAILR